MGQLRFPVVVVRERIAIHGLMLAAMNGEIGLAVAVQIELAQGDAACDRLLVDGCGYGAAVPGHVAWESGV